MNLLSLIAGVFGLLGGDKDAEGNHVFLGDQQEDGYVESTEQYTNLGGALDNLGAKITGSRLTRAEQQANAFTAEREDLAWQRQMEASNTAYQRQVADMQAAGINPMMAVSGSGGAAVPSASVHGSVTPGSASLNLGSIISAIVGAKQAKADIALKEAQANKANAEAASTEQQTSYFDTIKDVRAEAERLSNDMTRSQMRSVEQGIDESKARVGREIANTKESEARTKLALREAVLAKANADNIVFMRPYIAAREAAVTEKEQALAKASLVGAAYQQGLIDADVIGQGIKASNASIKVDDAIAELNRINALIAKGDKHALANELGNLDRIDFWANDVISTLTKIVDSIPINFVVK